MTLQKKCAPAANFLADTNDFLLKKHSGKFNDQDNHEPCSSLLLRLWPQRAPHERTRVPKVSPREHQEAKSSPKRSYLLRQRAWRKTHSPKTAKKRWKFSLENSTENVIVQVCCRCCCYSNTRCHNCKMRNRTLVSLAGISSSVPSELTFS